jgi:hypothetical protein
MNSNDTHSLDFLVHLVPLRGYCSFFGFARIAAEGKRGR